MIFLNWVIDKVLARNSNNNAATMLGPAGVSHVRELFKPIITERIPIKTAKTAICSGDLEKHLAAAAGIINRAVINKTPTIFMEMAITDAISIINMTSARSGCRPSARAISGLTVAANNGRQINFNTSNTTVPPSPITSKSN